MKLLIVLIPFLFFILSADAQAIYDPRDVPNNRYGIHVIDENDIDDAKNLVNSSGGDWGYITLVIRDDDRDREKWQNIFNRLRQAHLIPLVRLATRVEKELWIKPRPEDISSWVDFLASLNWVIENRYVIVFNEPNHAKEWGGELNPGEYAWYLKEFSRRLKEKSADFFILPGGLDASAPNSDETMDELTFLKQMLIKEPDVLSVIDGWISHSYPNPDFSGTPDAQGRGTVRTYLWELQLLANLGVYNDLPIFITETGWKHAGGRKPNKTYPAPEIVADHFRSTFNLAWNDPKIIAVTPFLLNYQEPPFDQFSWQKWGVEEFYPVYGVVQSLPKTAGVPHQYTTARFVEKPYPKRFVTNSVYTFDLEIENTGQSLVGGQEWNLVSPYQPAGFSISSGAIKEIYPYQKTAVSVRLTTPDTRGVYEIPFILTWKGNQTAAKSVQIELVDPPSLVLRTKLWYEKLAEGEDYSLQIFDREKLIIEFKHLPFGSGQALVDNLNNILPSGIYRLHLAKPFYLPRDKEVFITEGKTAVIFPMLLPFDPSNDGKLGLTDLFYFLRYPLRTLKLFNTL